VGVSHSHSTGSTRTAGAAPEPGTLAKPLLSGMSHALRNSLNAIGLTLMNASRQLDKEPLTPRRDDVVGQLQLAVDEVEVARATVVRFVELARKLEPVRERVGLGELVEAAFTHERPGNLPPPARVEVGPLPALTLACDPKLARGALAEVIANALDAREGAAQGVRVGAVREGPTVRIDVEDEGVGLTEGTLARCFEPFYAGRGERQGLGLPIARRYLEAQGGSVTIENRAGGRGARAVIRLPLA
jgi:signal transduction histidine kinase